MLRGLAWRSARAGGTSRPHAFEGALRECPETLGLGGVGGTVAVPGVLEQGRGCVEGVRRPRRRRGNLAAVLAGGAPGRLLDQSPAGEVGHQGSPPAPQRGPPPPGRLVGGRVRAPVVGRPSRCRCGLGRYDRVGPHAAGEPYGEDDGDRGQHRHDGPAQRAAGIGGEDGIEQLGEALDHLVTGALHPRAWLGCELRPGQDALDRLVHPVGVDFGDSRPASGHSCPGGPVRWR